VHAVGIGETRDIGAVVDDDAAIGGAGDCDDPVDQREEPPARVLFGPDLQEPRASAQAGLGERDGLDAPRGADGGIDDGIDDGRS
jgi:hypothetical protein